MIQSPALKKLAAKIVRAEIEKRNPVDLDAVADIVGRQIDVDGSGEIVAVDEHGVARVGRGPGFGIMGVAELLDEVVSSRPALFQGASAKSPPAGSDNPFAKGPSWSLSRQMFLLNTDPELADRLAAEAGAYVPRI